MAADYDPKYELLKSRLQQNPDSLLFARIADAMLGRGQVDEAIRICEEGIRKHPYYVTGHMVLGKCYLQKKLFDLAEKEFKRVILFDPKYIAAHKYYGDLMREVGWDNTCEMSYRKILNIDPLDQTVRQLLDTLEQVKPREQEVVTPEQPPFEMHVRNYEKKSESATAVPPQPITPRQKSYDDEPSSDTIDFEDDLFAEVEAEPAKPKAPETGRPQQVQAKPPEPEDDEEITSILEDIFEDDLERPDEPEAGKFDTIQDLNIKISHRPAAPKKKDEAPPKPPQKEEDPLETLDRFDEETIEFNQMRNLHVPPEPETPAPREDYGRPAEPAPTGEVDLDGDDDFFDALDLETQQRAETTPEPEEPPFSFDDEEETTVAEPAEEEPDEPAPFAGHRWDANDDEHEEEDKTAFWQFADDEPQRHAHPAATPEPEPEPEPEPMIGETANFDREKIVTPTLGEIYAAQGQYAKAINVFEILLKKDSGNQTYKQKIAYLKKRLAESQNA